MAITEAQRLEAESIRAAMSAASPVVSENADNDTAIKCMVLFEPWEPGPYSVGQARRYNDYPYKVYQAHDSTHNPDWTPEKTPALWTPYHGTTPETALHWVEPSGAHDRYLYREMMIWPKDGKIYECVATSGTNHSPESWAAGWKVVE